MFGLLKHTYTTTEAQEMIAKHYGHASINNVSIQSVLLFFKHKTSKIIEKEQKNTKGDIMKDKQGNIIVIQEEIDFWARNNRNFAQLT